MKKILFLCCICGLVAQQAWAGRAVIQRIATEPYASALVINAETGETLFADHADKQVYPASVLKLMVLLTIFDQVDQGLVHFEDMVQVTEEAYKMGGSQVYLDPSEQFSIDELLYALMIQSANDAAVALATHVAGSKEAFVALMNQKARELGMKNTRFYSVHGLPPSSGQHVDVTTARDFSLLCQELTRHPEVYKYTATKVRDFRQGKFIMRNHNHLLGTLPGCDGFKTGFFAAAGFSIAATAKRNGVRLIALVMGSQNRKVRDAKTIELINAGFLKASAQGQENYGQATSRLQQQHIKSAAQTAPATSVQKKPSPVESITPAQHKQGKSCLKSFLLGLITGAGILAALCLWIVKKQTRRNIRRPRL